MQELHYDCPTSLQDVVGLLDGGTARLLAGGTDLIPQLREGRRSASRIVNLKRIPELNAIERGADGSWRIGAAVTVGKLARNAAFAAEHAALLALTLLPLCFLRFYLSERARNAQLTAALRLHR